MRTLALIVACIGIGYGIAVSQFQKRTANIRNIMGSVEDMDEAIQKAKTSTQKPGKIEVIGGPEFDFGTMRLGTKRSHSFVFKNIGETPVEVVYKSATCKCTVGKLDATTLKAGEQTQVELEWLAEGSLSDFGQTATISTSAIDQEEIKLTIKGKIGQAHVFDPPVADFRDFLAAAESEQKGRLYSFEETPLEIENARWSDSHQDSKVICEMGSPKKLEIGEIPAFSDARYYLDFTIRLKRGLPAGALSGNMVFHKKSEKEDSKEGQIDFPIQGRCVSPIRVVAGPDYNEERNTFSLGSAKSSEGLKKSFVLAVKTDEPDAIQIKLAKVTPDSAQDAIRVTISELKGLSTKQKMFSVTVEIPPGTPPIEFAGTFGKDFAKIVLESNMESAPQFPMYIKFRILE